MIKFDLHIHSNASKYKESTNIVDDSNISNVDVLLKKLNDYDVSLFSITDHNRFNVALYNEIDRILKKPDCPYNKVKEVLAGVEFDVKIDEAMEKCHIITIFDANNKAENYQKISNEIGKNFLTAKDAYYTKKEFEDVLYNIGLNTILIACQRSDLNNHDGNHNSLSESTRDVEKILGVGYISALEYQKPKVEGIIKSNLRKLPIKIGLITGSDCHTWSCYPNHDKFSVNPDFYHSRARILPTFKGLLMAITSPETRFNCRENSNKNFYRGFNINGEEIPLVNGINAIIGENGSGKSTFLKVLNGLTREDYVKQIIKNNSLNSINHVDGSLVKYIKQGEIIERFNHKQLFNTEASSNFKLIDTSKFEETYKDFATVLKDKIEYNIHVENLVGGLKDYTIQYDPTFETKNYYISVSCPEQFSSSENMHEVPLNSIKKLILQIKKLIKQDYFSVYKDQLNIVLAQLLNVYNVIFNKWILLKSEGMIKNAIQRSVQDYDLKVSESLTSKDQDKKEYFSKRQKIIDCVCNTIQVINKKPKKLNKPEILSGYTSNPIKGFYFNRVAKFNNNDVLEEFMKYMFNKEYQNVSKLETIKSNAVFSQAIKGCSNESDITKVWNSNLTKFISEYIIYNEFITDASKQKVGNTLGEMSISFYKYYTQLSDKWSVLIIDQPEDNISNNNINHELIKYFNSLRDTKQIIYVTHNPLLVVNQDVDNVIYLDKKDSKIDIQCGCLEYEDENVNVLNTIADKMDGGKETIEKRIRVYGENY